MVGGVALIVRLYSRKKVMASRGWTDGRIADKENSCTDKVLESIGVEEGDSAKVGSS